MRKGQTPREIAAALIAEGSHRTPGGKLVLDIRVDTPKGPGRPWVLNGRKTGAAASALTLIAEMTSRAEVLSR
jgi:hypothetical protein